MVPFLIWQTLAQAPKALITRPLSSDGCSSLHSVSGDATLHDRFTALASHVRDDEPNKALVTLTLSRF